MPEYIERENLIEDLNYIASEYARDGSMQCLIAAGTAIHIKDDVVLKAPTADVIEVTRCAECRHYNPSCMPNGFGWCEYYNTGAIDEHYCSHGEKELVNGN